MHQPGLGSTPGQQGPVVFHSPCIELALVFQQTRHGQPGIHPIRLQFNGFGITNTSLCVLGLLAAQMPGLQPASVMVRKISEQLRKTFAGFHVLASKDQAPDPLQGRLLQMGRRFQDGLVAGLRWLPLASFEELMRFLQGFGQRRRQLGRVLLGQVVVQIKGWAVHGVPLEGQALDSP